MALNRGQRACVLVAVSIAAGAIAGWAACAIMAPFAAFIGAVFGAIIGLLVSPLVVVLLFKKLLGAAPLVLLAVAGGAGLLGGWTLHPGAALLSVVVFLGAAALAACVLPNAPRAISPGHCEGCGYERGALAVCPECGLAPSRPPERDPRVRRAALAGAIAVLAGGLGLLVFAGFQRHRVRSVPELVEQLGANDMDLQWEARHALIERDPGSLVRALSHPKVGVRRNAAWALEERPMPEARPALERLLNDPDPWTRDHAKRALEGLGAK